MRDVLRSRTALHLCAVTLLPLSLLLAGCERVPKPEAAGFQSPVRSGSTAPALSQWRRLAPSPLSARSRAVSVTIGGRALFFGGTSEPDRCPPPGDCSAPAGGIGYTGPAFQDGAAYDPAADTWVMIASAPVPLGEVASSPSVELLPPVDIGMKPLAKKE